MLGPLKAALLAMPLLLRVRVKDALVDSSLGLPTPREPRQHRPELKQRS